MGDKVLRSPSYLEGEEGVGKYVTDAGKNTDTYAELIQLLDDRRLSPIMHDAKDDGKKALQILKEHALYESRKTEGDCLVR